MKNNDDIILCFCEDITRGEVRRAIEEGVTTLEGLKRLLRVGMGRCQGKTCESLIVNEIMSLTGKSREEILLPKKRPMTVGITIEDVTRSVEYED